LDLARQKWLLFSVGVPIPWAVFLVLASHLSKFLRIFWYHRPHPRRENGHQNSPGQNSGQS
jgi:hypothetical protein